MNWIIFGIKWLTVNTGTVLNACTCKRSLLDMKMSWNGKIQRDWQWLINIAIWQLSWPFFAAKYDVKKKKPISLAHHIDLKYQLQISMEEPIWMVNNPLRSHIKLKIKLNSKQITNLYHSISKMEIFLINKSYCKISILLLMFQPFWNRSYLHSLCIKLQFAFDISTSREILILTFKANKFQYHSKCENKYWNYAAI